MKKKKIVIGSIVFVFILLISLFFLWLFTTVTEDFFLSLKPINDPKPLSISFDISEENTVYIHSEQDLNKLSDEVNNGNTYQSKTVVLTKDLYFDKSVENNFKPIGGQNVDKVNRADYAENSFQGNFDGKGHIIHNINMTITTPSEFKHSSPATGVFGLVKNGVIQNIIIKDSIIQISGGATVGCISGICLDSIIKNCKNESDMIINTEDGSGSVGGIVGRSYDSVIESCVNKGQISITGKKIDLGGIAGWAASNHEPNYIEEPPSKSYQTVVRNCYYAGKIKQNDHSVDNMRIGGITGCTSAMIENCYCIGSFDVKCDFGAISHLGQNSYNASDCYIRNCFFSNKSAKKGSTRKGLLSYDGVSMNEETMKTDQFLNQLNDQPSEYLKGKVFWERSDQSNNGFPDLINNPN